MIRNIISNELFTIILTLGLVIITAAKVAAPKRFFDFLFVLGNSKYLKIYSKDLKFYNKFDLILFINLLLSVALFCSIFYKSVLNADAFSFQSFIKVALGIGAFLLIKTHIERFIGYIFNIETLINAHVFQKMSYINFLGVLLIPINAFLIFSFSSFYLVYAILILLFIINILGLMTSFKRHQSSIKPNLFYFILYLCALEIAPYIILYKVFISK